MQLTRCSLIGGLEVLGCLSLALTAAVDAAPTTRPAAPATQPAAISVDVCAVYSSAQKLYPADERLTVFNNAPPFEVSLDLATTHGTIVAAQGSITSFGDDTGRSFKMTEEESGLDLKRGIVPRAMSSDGQRARFTLSPNAPLGAGATRVRVAGKGHLTLASDVKSVDAGLIAVKEGSAFKLGSVAFKVAGVTDDNGKLTVSMETHQDTSSLRALKFYDDKGQLLETTIGGSTSQSFAIGKLQATTLTVDYSLPRKVDRVRIEGEQWVDLSSAPFAFDISAGPGLGAVQTPPAFNSKSRPATTPANAGTPPASQPAAALPAAVQEVRCVGFMAEKPEPRDSGFMVINPGTSVAVLVVVKQGHIIGWGGDGTEISALSDDRGTDLLKAKGDTFHEPGLDRSADFSQDERAMVVKINSPRLASPEARSLRVKGVIAIDTASTEKSVTVDKVSLVEKGAFQVGPLHYTISHAGKPQFADDGFSVSLKTTDDISSLDDLQFFDANGKNLATRPGVSGSVTINGKTEHEREFVFDKKLDSAKIVAKLWTDSTPVKVPLDLTVSLGTPGAK